MNRIIITVLATAVVAGVTAQEPTRWRGPSGNGIYPETDLLDEWSPAGPEILWSYEELGQGHSSAAVSQGHVYTSGMINGTGYLFKFTMDGELVYRIPYGKEFTESWHGTRGTPAIAGDRIYLLSGHGKLVCFRNADGSIVWSKELFRAFDGSNITWGVNETPVVDGDVIYATPGGRNNNVVALDRHTGDLVWSSRGESEPSAYCTPLLFTHNGRKILATHTKSHLIGLDAATGELLWSKRHTNRWDVHPNTPIYHEGELFYFSGYGQGGGKLKLNGNGGSVSTVWETATLDSRMGGAVLVDGYLYGSGDVNREWQCIDWETGEQLYSSSGIAKGNVIYADGKLYCYSERGELALVKAGPSGFNVISEIRVEKGSEQHWAHPMIHGGVLYVRHGRALIAYDIRR